MSDKSTTDGSGSAEHAASGTDHCINCGDKIDGDGVYLQSGVKSDGLDRLADEGSVPLSDLMEMDDGPYCSLACSVDAGTDQNKSMEGSQ